MGRPQLHFLGIPYSRFDPLSSSRDCAFHKNVYTGSGSAQKKSCINAVTSRSTIALKIFCVFRYPYCCISIFLADFFSFFIRAFASFKLRVFRPYLYMIFCFFLGGDKDVRSTISILHLAS